MKALGAASAWWLLLLGIATAQSPASFPGTIDQHPAIDYDGGALTDAVTQLRRDVDAGATTLTSYMIYSPAFDALAPEAKSAVLARLREQVTDRATIEILDHTKPGWRQ